MGHLSLALVAAGLFATTNVDDLFLLVGFFSDRNLAPWQVVLGQIVGVSVLIAVSLAAAIAALAFSPSYVGLLGFAPIVLGAWKFRTLLVDGRAAKSLAESRGRLKSVGAPGVALVTIASGSDNIGVYTPFLAARAPAQIAVIVFIFILLTVVWCFAARWLVAESAIGTFLRRVAPIVLPIVLIVLGASILYATGAGALIMKFVHI
jgi:cadmium resistance protein CadD (predicted permease)